MSKIPVAKGFFHLRTPLDLLRKMEHHAEEMSADMLNEYAAFDFFVAATHMKDWLKHFGCPASDPADHKQRERDWGIGRRTEALCSITSDLGNGAKHFSVNSHDAVQRHTQTTPAYSGLARSAVTFSDGLRPKLLVQLAPDEAAALGVEAISTISLAHQVLEFWKEHAAIKQAAAKMSDSTV